MPDCRCAPRRPVAGYTAADRAWAVLALAVLLVGGALSAPAFALRSLLGPPRP